MNRNEYLNRLLAPSNLKRVVNYIININDIHDNYREKMLPVVFNELKNHYNKYQINRDSFDESDIEKTVDLLIENRSEEIIYNTINPNVKLKKSYVMPTINVNKYQSFDHDKDDGIHGSYGLSNMKIYTSKDKKWSRVKF